jgi:hypothetical protein
MDYTEKLEALIDEMMITGCLDRLEAEQEATRKLEEQGIYPS